MCTLGYLATHDVDADAASMASLVWILNPIMDLRSNSACWATLWSLFYYRVLWMEVWTLPIVRRGLRVLAKRTRVWMLKLTASTSWVVTLLTTWRFSFSLSKLPWLHLALLLGEIFYKLYCPSPQESLQRQQYWFSLGGWATGFEGGRAWEVPSHFSGLLKEGLEADDLAEMYTSVHAAIHAAAPHGAIL